MREVIRRRYVFTGHVQGVGFRWKACRAADLLGITGWVRNEWNDSVTMEAQGTKEALDQMLVLLNADRYIQIDSAEMRVIRADENERSFRVRES